MFIHVVACTWLNNIPFYEEPTFCLFICQLIITCFQHLAVVNSSPRNCQPYIWCSSVPRSPHPCRIQLCSVSLMCHEYSLLQTSLFLSSLITYWIPMWLSDLSLEGISLLRSSLTPGKGRSRYMGLVLLFWRAFLRKRTQTDKYKGKHKI